MTSASAVGIFVIPMLYVVFQGLRERSGALAYRRAQQKWLRGSKVRHPNELAVAKIKDEQPEDRRTRRRRTRVGT